MPSDGPSSTALPAPLLDGSVSLEAALAVRRSVREFSSQPLSPTQISQLLWSAQGITDPEGDRTAPSAGALFPLELYVATAEGLFLYQPAVHSLLQVAAQDFRSALYRQALAQEALLQAPAVFVIAAVYRRTEVRYGKARSPRYVHMEVGHAAENLLLQAAALGLGAVVIGAFEDARLKKALGLPADQEPLYLIPVGHPRR